MSGVIPFLALPLPDEGPLSVLQRTAERNGYATLTAFNTHYAAGKFISATTVMLSKAALIVELAKLADKHAIRFESAFYRQLPGLTSSSPVLLAGTRLPYEVLRTSKRQICPQCIQEGWSRFIHDLSFIDACPYHSCMTIEVCPECGREIDWNVGGMASCNCKFDFRTIKPVEVDVSGVQKILVWLKEQNTSILQRLINVLKSLRFEETTDRAERNQLLNSATALINGEANAMLSIFESARSRYPGLPVRSLAAPWLVALDDEIRNRIEAVLMAESAEFPSSCDGCACAHHTFSLQEIQAVLKVNTQLIRQMEQHGFLVRDKRKNNRQTRYLAESVCRLFRLLVPNGQSSDELEQTPLLVTGLSNASAIQRLLAVRDGTKRVITADARQGLWDVIVSGNSKPISSIPENIMTVTQAAAQLGTYPDAVRRVIKVGLLPVQRKGTTVLINKSDLDSFEQVYVFVGTLAKKLQAGRTVLSTKLAHLGIMPVSGPTVDGGLVPLYRRDQVETITTDILMRIENFKSNSGRKKGDPILYDKKQWVTAVDAAKKLGLTVQGLQALLNYGLLREGVPPGRDHDNRRYFTVVSLVNAAKWLQSAVSLEQAAIELDRSVDYIRSRFLRSKYIRPLRLCAKTYIGKEDRVRMQRHLAAFCTCAEASAFLQAPPKHFHNLLATGRINAVSDKEVDGLTSIKLLRWCDVKEIGGFQD